MRASASVLAAGRGAWDSLTVLQPTPSSSCLNPARLPWPLRTVAAATFLLSVCGCAGASPGADTSESDESPETSSPEAPESAVVGNPTPNDQTPNDQTPNDQTPSTTEGAAPGPDSRGEDAPGSSQASEGSSSADPSEPAEQPATEDVQEPAAAQPSQPGQPPAGPAASATTEATATQGPLEAEATAPAEGAASAEPNGPCGHPPVHFRIDWAEGAEICSTELFVEPFFPFGFKLVWEELSENYAVSSVVPEAGRELVWNGEVEVRSLGACTDAEGVPCAPDSFEKLCFGDASAMLEADGTAPLGQRDDSGLWTITFMATPLTPRGSCANDQMWHPIGFDPLIDSSVHISAADFELPFSPDEFDCGGTATCTTDSQYCEAHYTSTGPTDGVCRDLPSECIGDHTCDCLTPHLDAGLRCSTQNISGPVSVIWPE